jgi:SAM-dependent MidA family methyltransferase
MNTCPNLTSYIQQEIQRHNGNISFARFMELALYHPQFGYYNAESFSIGKQGDFITAPEMSPLFAQCLARQCVPCFERLATGDLLELGAGSGRLAGDLLSALQQFGALPEHYYIYEISLNLRKKQQLFLQTNFPEFFPRIVWLEQLPTAFTGIIIANEVLDALPVHCFAIQETGIAERCVGTSQTNVFAWQLTTPTSEMLRQKAAALRDQYELYPGYATEICLYIAPFMQQVVTALQQGLILFIDYGYGQREYYHPERQQGTLNCFYQHQQHADPLLLPGQQDITAHVDFTWAAENAVLHDCTVNGFTTQTSFLLACGLMDLAAAAAKNLTATEEFQLHQAVKRLTWPTEMGERVKVMALGKDFVSPLIGFSLQDRRRDL